jgi:hypothetical protein
MPRIVAAAAAALLLALAPAASASIWPQPTASPVHAFGIRVLKVPPMRMATRACMRHSARKVARWLAPVACEQPPRSEVLLLPLLNG